MCAIVIFPEFTDIIVIYFLESNVTLSASNVKGANVFSALKSDDFIKMQKMLQIRSFF